MSQTTSQTLTAGAGYGAPIQVWGGNYRPPTITAIPGVGGAMLVQYSTSSPEEIASGLGNWNNWPAGSVSVYTSDSLLGAANYIRASATTANGVLEVCQ